MRHTFELSASCFTQAGEKCKLQVQPEETIDRRIVIERGKRYVVLFIYVFIYRNVYNQR